MTENTPFRPLWASPPGETISDCLERRKLTRTTFAKRIGRSSEAVNSLLSGDSQIDQRLAERLHRVIGGSSRFWLRRETEYQDDLRRLNIAHDPEKYKSWLAGLPVTDMVKFGWIQPTKTRTELVSACLSYFGTTNLESWRQHYETLTSVVAFRSSGSFKSRPGAVAAWLRRGEIEANKIICKPWNSDTFFAKLQKIRFLTRKKSPSYFVPVLQDLCSECGVAVVIAPAPKGCRASGATRFLSPEQALLLLSFRYKRDDQFWFTFFHEAAHLLLHDRAALFVEGDDMLPTHEEEEANEFAASILVPPQFRGEMLELGQNYRGVLRFAHNVGVSPGIVVGQLQHHGRIAHNRLNFLKRRIDWEDDHWHVIRERERTY